MGVFKEQIHFFEDLERKQSQIFSDSCDYGILASDIDVDMMRESIELLLGLKGSKITFRANKPAVQRKYELIVAHGECAPYCFDATQINVLYYKDKKEFFSIKVKHVVVDENHKPFMEK